MIAISSYTGRASDLSAFLMISPVWSDLTVARRRSPWPASDPQLFRYASLSGASRNFARSGRVLIADTGFEETPLR